MAADQQALQPSLAADHPASPQVQQQASQKKIDNFCQGIHEEDKEEQFIDHNVLDLKDERERVNDDFTFHFKDAPLHQTDIFLLDQRDVLSVPLEQGLELEPPFTPINQAILPSRDETVASEELVVKVSCDQPGCYCYPLKRKADLIQHMNERFIDINGYPCRVLDCNKKGDLHDHERKRNYSEAPRSQKSFSTKISQKENEALALDAIRIPNVIGPRHLLPWNHDLARQGLHSDLIRLKPAIEDGCGNSEDTCTTSDGFSVEDSMSTRSTSSQRTIASKNSTTLHSTGQVEESSRHKRQFACPYRKQDRHKYNARIYKTCAISGWPTVARVKEHIYRRHKALPQCRRCSAQFKTQEGLDKHSRVTEPCEIRRISHAEGISAEIEKRLKSKRRDQSEEMRWREMYRLLFPESNVPSPYFESLEDVAPPEGFTFPDASSSASNEIENTKPPNPSDWAACVRDDFLRTFNTRLKHGVPTISDSLRSELVSIAAECHNRSITEFAEANTSNKDVIIPPTRPNSVFDEYMSMSVDEFEHAFYPWEEAFLDYKDGD